MKQMDTKEDTLKYRGAQRATYKSRVSHSYAHTQSRADTTIRVCTWDPGCDLEAVAAVDAPEGKCVQGRHV